MPSPRTGQQGRRARACAAACALAVALLPTILLAAQAPAEQAAAPASPQAGALDVDAFHSCALTAGSAVRCWGQEVSGQLGYAGSQTIGDDEPPAAAGPVDLGPGRTARAIATGNYHSCALLDNGSVRCWGYGTSGQLGYASSATIGDDEAPASAGPVDLGPGRTARAITAGSVHTCAVLDDGSARCWGYGEDGRLGYANTSTIGDDETPGSIPPIDLGLGRRAVAISAGTGHTCAVLDDASVRCWGFGRFGELGNATGENVGDNETPGSVEPVDLGPGATADAISAGDVHTCAVLGSGEARCWGEGGYGRLGTGSTRTIGDDESPSSIAAVDVGAGRTVSAISAGAVHTCARLDDGTVRCWGYGADGRLGDCSDAAIGDDEPPSAIGAIDLEARGAGCAVAPRSPAGGGAAAASPARRRAGAQTLRWRQWNRCMAAARRGAGSRRARTACTKRHGRIPGRVIKLRGRARSRTTVVLTFSAPGTDGARPPAARRYLVKQSPRPIRSRRDAAQATALCRGSCRFSVTRVGTRIRLTITKLRPRRTYHYTVAAFDNVSGRPGRPRAVTVRTP